MLMVMLSVRAASIIDAAVSTALRKGAGAASALPSNSIFMFIAPLSQASPPRFAQRLIRYGKRDSPARRSLRRLALILDEQAGASMANLGRI
jgi:hypothetical protein